MDIIHKHLVHSSREQRLDIPDLQEERGRRAGEEGEGGGEGEGREREGRGEGEGREREGRGEGEGKESA